MTRTIVTLDVATGSYTNIADDVSISGVNVGISGSLTITGSVYFKNVQIDTYPISSNAISGSLTKLADGSNYLVAGTSVQLTSSSNGSVVISSDVSELAGGVNAVAYSGYCTGSLTWNSTTWTDFHTVPGNFTDRIQQGITRNNSTFTVVSGGNYYFQSDFNHQVQLAYIAWRISGSNGTIIQQTSRGSFTPDDGDGADLTGVFQMSANESFKLQYVYKVDPTWGAVAQPAWSPLDPLDGENMRTGAINIFRVGKI